MMQFINMLAAKSTRSHLLLSSFSGNWNAKLLYSLCFFIVFLRNSGEAVIKLPANMTIPAIFAYGDSIVDQGNNNNLQTVTKCNFPPYGRDFMGGVATGRFSNAKTPPDLIAEELGIKELVPAYLDPHLQAKDLPTGVSFASGGAGFDPQTASIVSVIPFSKQLDLFKKYITELKGIVGEEKANFIIANAIHFIVAGSDDIANTYYTVGIRRTQYDINSYIDLMVSSATDFILELYNLGCRRIGIFGVPPIGCVPSQRTLGGGPERACAENYNQAAQLFNTKIKTRVDSIKKSYPGIKLVYIDIYNSVMKLIQNPQDFGFEVVDRGCCGTGYVEVVVLCNKYSNTCPDDSKYLFWDSYHPTEKGYRILVQGLLQTYTNSFI